MTPTQETTKAQDAMVEHLAYLVYKEGRPASWQDFAQFEVDGKLYTLTQGTIRNNFSYLKRIGMIELAYRSINSYYTLPGENSQEKGSAMTPDHTWVKPSTKGGTMRSVYDSALTALIDRMPFDGLSAHNIRLRFDMPGIYNTLGPLTFLSTADRHASIANRTTTTTTSSFEQEQMIQQHKETLQLRKRSKDLVFKVMMLGNGVKGYLTIHDNDVVSIILSCSESPIRFDIEGWLLSALH